MTSATASETVALAPRARRAPREVWTGIGFPVLFVAGVVASSPPADGASNATWIANYTGTGRQAGHLASGVLLLLSGLCLAAFLTALWRRIRDASPAISPLPLVMAGVAAAAISAGGVVMAFVSSGELTGKYPLPSAAMLRMSNDLGFGLAGVAGMLAAAVAVAVLSKQGRAAGILGRRTYVFGIVVAVMQLASIEFIPIVALLLWTIVIAVQWLREPAA